MQGSRRRVAGRYRRAGTSTPSFPAQTMALLSCRHWRSRGVTLPEPALQACAALWEVITGKPLGKERPLWGPVTPARPQGSCDPPPTLLFLPAMGLLRLRPVAQKWTRSTSWLATGRWQAEHVMGRERCFSPRQGRHRRWPQGSWYTGSFLK